MDETSLYFHIPFCRKRCSYCDFTTYAGMESLMPAYVKALCQEIATVADSCPRKLPVHTMYFGGGTPSLLELGEWKSILMAVAERFTLSPQLEMSLEANPGTVSQDYLKGLKGFGFNRISLGMQSAHPDDLRLLERLHTTPEVIQAVGWARKAGFDNLNLDLILGLPHQSLERWQKTLDFALNLAPDHLSVYALTVEPSTPLYTWVRKGWVSSPDGDLAADMYDWTEERLDSAGFTHYEISNWGRRSAGGVARVCRHNLQYWRNRPYLGFGAGAHGYAAGMRTINQSGIQRYLRSMADPHLPDFPHSPANVEVIPIDRSTEMQETMMVGLRLLEEGVSEKKFTDRFGETIEETFLMEIEGLVQKGLLEWVNRPERAVRLTRRGHLLGNQVFMQFVEG